MIPGHSAWADLCGCSFGSDRIIERRYRAMLTGIVVVQLVGIDWMLDHEDAIGVAGGGALCDL